MKILPLLAGVAGEYYVAAELSRRGHIASISLRNTRGIDILATNADASRSITIQCKTNQFSHKEWILNEKSESFYSADHYYVFVALGDVLTRPSFHIVPSKAVADFTTKSHRDWLRTPGRKGRKHVDNSMRKFLDKEDKYLEQWELLRL